MGSGIIRRWERSPGPDRHRRRGARTRRPPRADRRFTSGAIERRIAAAAARIGEPSIRGLFASALPNTLDTTVTLLGTDAAPDTFVVTGDIEAMWLRDSTAQVWPYVGSALDDPALDLLLRGVIARQARSILLDPYANAFLLHHGPSEFAADHTVMLPGVHERKWEPDSVAAFCRLSAGYAAATGSLRPFEATWRGALELALRTLRVEQRLAGPSPYRFGRPNDNRLDHLPNGDDVAPSRPNGMVHTAFRPSDDAAELPLNVPVNLAVATSLDQVAPVADAAGAPGLANEARAIAAAIRSGVARDGVIADAHGARYAYEVDGLGGIVEMDDANAPSLLSLPYLGACPPNSPLSLATRGRILSPANPWWSAGRLGDGIGSPHTGPRRVWPIAVAMRGLTAADDAERVEAARLLGASHAGTHLAHESFDIDDPSQFSRPWFAWANSLVGEFLESMALRGLLA
ncbi:MAG: glycoside hydrolase family 125 protein [Chloroflexota bacterium]